MAIVGNEGIWIRIMGEVTDALNKIGSVTKAVGQFESTARNASQKLGGVFDPLFSGMVKGATAVTAALGSIAGLSLKVGGGFEYQMQLVRGVASATDEQFKTLVDRARELGATLPVTAADSAQAMYQLASAGMKADEILASIGNTVNISLAQGYGLAESAGLLVATLRSFELASEQSGRVVDVFSNAVSNSMLTMEKLDNAMRYAAPTAHTLGLSLEETVAAMEALSEAGLEGTMIGTGIRQVLSSLVAPTSEATKIFEKFGISIYDASGKMKPLADVVAEIKRSGMGAEEIFKVFGDRGATAMQILITASDRLGQFEAGLKKTGRTQELVSGQMQTFPNIVKGLTSAMEETLHVVFDGIKARAGAFVNSVTDMVRALNVWAKETDAVGKIINSFFAGFGIAVPSVDQFKAALDRVDIEAVAARFRWVAETISRVAGAFADLASKVPWRFLIDHLKEIATVIAVGWAAGKIAAITAAISGLVNVFVALNGALAASQLASWISLFPAAVTSIGNFKTWIGLAVSALNLPAVGFIAVVGLAALMLKGLWDEFKRGKEATQAFADATSKGVDELKALGAAALKNRIASLTEQIERMHDTMGGPQGSGGENPQIARWREALANAKAALVELEKESTNAAETLDRNKKMVEDFMAMGKDYTKSAPSGSEAAAVAKPFTAEVRDAIEKAVTEFAAYSRNLVKQTEVLVKGYGMNAVAAADAVKTELVGKAGEAGDKLVETFNNPLIKTLFGTALRKVGKAGGDALLVEVGAALDGADKLLAEFKEKVDEYTKQVEALKEKQKAGEVNITDESERGVTYYEKQTLAGTQSEWDKERGNAAQDIVIWDKKTLEKPVAEAALAASQVETSWADALAKSTEGAKALQTVLDGIAASASGVTGVSEIPGQVADALAGIAESGASAGAATGQRFGAAFLEGVNAAVGQAKQAIAEIPRTIDLKVSSKGLAGEIAAAGRS